ncbi:MAG: RNA methyltransferase [Acidimicrobiales bacterium]|nr:RNA methyltransferase [Acidimicrobiales bacterium]
MLEGPTLLGEALACGWPLQAVALPAGAPPELAGLADRAVAAGAERLELADGVLERVADTVTPRAVLAVATLPAGAHVPAAATFVVVAVDLADPGNAGTLLRTAEAAGADALVVCAGSVDPFSPKAVRASAGSVLRIPVVAGGAAPAVLAALGTQGLRRVGTVAGGGSDYDAVDLTRPVAVVLGGEARGLGPGTVSLLDEVVTIPMGGRAESLNVAAAGAVMCFEVARQRRVAAGASG